MNYFPKKLFNKLKVYYFYFINEKSRKFFFILIWRKINTLFNKNSGDKFNKNFILEWCNRKIISEQNFYRRIGWKNSQNFFDDKIAY